MGDMQYRKLPHGGEKISVIGLGMGSIHEGSKAEIEDTLKLAIESGINYFDMAASEAKPYPCYARAFEGKGNRFIFRCILVQHRTEGNCTGNVRERA